MRFIIRELRRLFFELLAGASNLTMEGYLPVTTLSNVHLSRYTTPRVRGVSLESVAVVGAVEVVC